MVSTRPAAHSRVGLLAYSIVDALGNCVADYLWEGEKLFEQGLAKP